MKILERSHKTVALIKWNWLNVTLIIFLVVQGLIFVLPIGYILYVNGFPENNQGGAIVMMSLGFFMSFCFLLSAVLMGLKRKLGYWIPIGLYLFSLTRLPDDYMAGLLTWGYWALFGFSTLLTLASYFLYLKFFKKTGP